MRLATTLKVVNLPSDPASTESGQIYFNTQDNSFKVSTSGSWFSLLDVNNFDIQSAKTVTEISSSAAYFSYTIVENDSNSILMSESASISNFIVPSNSTYEIPIGTTIKVVRSGEGEVQFTGESGVTINSPSDIYLTAQWSDIDLIKVGTNSWILSGEFPDIY